MIRVVVAKDRRSTKDFYLVPRRLYADDPIFTPPLQLDLERSLSDRNPLWREGRGERVRLVAYDGDNAVGRMLAHVHHASNSLHAERVGFFGLFDCPDDTEIARALFAAAAEFHLARGLTMQRGPYELSITQCIGAVTAGFDEPASFGQSWSPPHVPRLLEQLGFEPVYRAASFRLDDVAACDPDALISEKHRAWLRQPSTTVRPWRLDRFDADVRTATRLLNESFAGNFGFVPLSEAEIAFMAGPLKRVVRPELTIFLELEGEPVGVGMCLPDFHVLFRRMGGKMLPLGWAQFLLGARALDGAVFQFIATTPRLQNQGLMRIIVAELLRSLQRAGIRTVDGTWIGDVNPKSRAQALAIGMREKHRLALYARAI